MVSFLPPGLILLFSLHIFRNLKTKQKRRQRIHPLPINTSTTSKRSTSLYTINLMYTVLTMNYSANKSTEAFTSFIAGMLVYVCPCLSFYSFALASRLFRKELKSIICHI